jgi:hypothetical protein
MIISPEKLPLDGRNLVLIERLDVSAEGWQVPSNLE